MSSEAYPQAVRKAFAKHVFSLRRVRVPGLQGNQLRRVEVPGLRALLFLTVFILCLVANAGAAVKAYRGQLEIPTYDWLPPVKHPYFRNTDEKNIYPYPMLDSISLKKAPRTYQTVVLENEYLRITFLPELGGKIHEVIDKTTGQPMFYVNHVVKPGLIAQCGAWTSGGVEWNTGPQGHTVSAMQPVRVEILPENADGSRSVAVGEVERIYRTRWTVVVTLRPGRSFIEERVRIYNGTETVRPYYFWNCTASPNPPGFRFIYPMTMGFDHSGEKFFKWPIDNGKDLTRGTNYEDASSIFAWNCDQDFFGSYDDGAQRGVVAYANHHQLPGKKAWTWGQGGFGRMHQMDLTDSDGPYNEVQTGPLLTQGQVGRLEPCEAVSWQEWWYPVHGIGGFTYANKNLAANATVENGQLRLRVLATGKWRARFSIKRGMETMCPEWVCDLNPSKPMEFKTSFPKVELPVTIEIKSEKGEMLATWRSPLDLPVRTPPEKKGPAKTQSEMAQAGWENFLFAKFDEAERDFRFVSGKDNRSSVAQLVGLAHLYLDRDTSSAARYATQALEFEPESGAAHYVLAVAEARQDNNKHALEEAWKSTLDPALAVPGRALVAKLLIREHRLAEAIAALSEPGPWRNDALCLDRLVFAQHESGDVREAKATLRAAMEIEPMDGFARSVAWLDMKDKEARKQAEAFGRDSNELLEIAAQYYDLGCGQRGYLLFQNLPRNTLLDCLLWEFEPGAPNKVPVIVTQQGQLNWPYQFEMLQPLKRMVQAQPQEGLAALLLGNLCFHLGRTEEAREMWRKAVELGASPTVALRALGMASLKVDDKPDEAVRLLMLAHARDSSDAIIARDLARVLFKQLENAEADKKKELLYLARNVLRGAFAAGCGRSDFVSLLARAYNQLGEYNETASMLDQVRIKVWEGAREAHDLFEEAHLALGQGHLEAGRATEALKEFNRALEYPENLATGKMENAREAHIQYLRGHALAALGRKTEAVTAWKRAANEPESKDVKKNEAREKAREALTRAGKIL